MKWQQMTEQERKAYSQLDSQPESKNEGIKYKETKKVLKQPENEQPAYTGPPPPKKPSNSFIHFKAEKCKQIAEEEKITYAEALKKLGTIWSSMKDEEKKPYEDMQKAEEAKYKAELEKFKADGGVIQPKVAAPVQ